MTLFLQGFNYAFSGFTLVRHTALRWHVLLPALCSILLLASALWFGYTKIQYFTEFVNSYLPSFLSWLAPLLSFLIVPLVLIISFYVVTILANVIAAPFNGFLSEKVETLLVGYPPPSNGRLIKKFKMLAHMIGCELRKLTYILLFSIPLIILSFIPVINLAMPFVWIIAGSWLLCVEYMDYPMGNHNIRFTQQLSLLKHHRKVALGFGLGIMLLTVIPVLNLFAMPIATCSATKLWVDYFSQYYKD